jgi:hypothetical protein
MSRDTPMGSIAQKFAECIQSSGPPVLVNGHIVSTIAS